MTDDTDDTDLAEFAHLVELMSPEDFEVYVREIKIVYTMGISYAEFTEAASIVFAIAERYDLLEPWPTDDSDSSDDSDDPDDPDNTDNSDN